MSKSEKIQHLRSTLSCDFFVFCRTQTIADFGVALMLLVTVTFVPSSFIAYIILERKSEEKHVQLVAGVSKVTYWCTAFLWDITVWLF